MISLHPIDHSLLQDETSFEVLFRQLYSSVCKTIYKIVLDRDVAEDITQDAFVVLWEKRAEVTVSVKSYLYRAAINKAFNHLEKSKRWVRSPEDGEGWHDFTPIDNTTEETIILGETQKKVEEALNSLPPACRTVFLMSRMDEMSYKEIAEVLQISIKTVENQMSKALRILRERLGPLAVVFLLYWLKNL